MAVHFSELIKKEKTVGFSRIIHIARDKETNFRDY
jgi:hypothetical protein